MQEILYHLHWGPVIVKFRLQGCLDKQMGPVQFFQFQVENWEMSFEIKQIYNYFMSYT